ncbi:MAG: hypothetical protein QG597_593 [Actinomycetota bacterium]|nr:hypothetical protein [Actinomycetota bacterium]
MAELKPAWTFVRERRYLALRSGVVTAISTIGPSFARGLLPRSTTDQAMVTGATAAYGLGFASLGLATVEAVSELIVKSRRSGDTANTTLAATTVVALAGVTVIALVPDDHEVPMSLATAQSVARVVTAGAYASALVIGAEKVMAHTVGVKGLPTNLAVAVAIGGGVSGFQVLLRNRRAKHHDQGKWHERRPTRADRAPVKVAKSIGIGAAVAGGLVALAGAQFAIAEGTPKLVSHALGRSSDPVTPLVGHAAAATILGTAGVVALNRLRRHLLHTDDVVEPAYPDPPTSAHVTAGPTSVVAFDAIGKEGRRFVLMALTPQEITDVMGESAKAPVRAVAGYGSAASAEDRAKIALAELDRLGAFDRSVIVVAAPTGVGYVNYSFAEAVEYLTRGDCAIIVPQYALVPSALALNLTGQGIAQQRLILAGIRDRIAAMPPQRRPRLLQFGESLGAQVALDVVTADTVEFDALGIDRGLYLGTPFRTKLWERWFHDHDRVDPLGLLGQVSQASEIADLPASVRHVQIVHQDDPINMFGYSMLVRAPWWMGPPQTRPPGVPRETAFRPVITFIITLMDLKNGMNSKPGEFVRQGHDYRIELCEAVKGAYDLPANAKQSARIEAALRERERDWATRRMDASRFAKARDSVMAQLSKWGVDADADEFDAQNAAALARGEVIRRPSDEAARAETSALSAGVTSTP